MKTVAYLKTSLDRQEVQEQKRVILEFAHREGITVSHLIEMPASTAIGKRIEQLFTQVASGDKLIVSELSRIGRSVGQIVRTVEALIKGKVCFIAVKEGIWLDSLVGPAALSLRTPLNRGRPTMLAWSSCGLTTWIKTLPSQV